MVKSGLTGLLTLLVSAYSLSSWALSFNAVTAFGDQLEINARVAGLIDRVEVSAGQRVKRGDVLLEIETTPYQTAYERAVAQHKAAQPKLQNAEYELERAFELYDRDSLSTLELRRAEMAVAAAQGELEALAADMKLAQYWLKHTTIRAPLAGLVLDVSADQGEYVNPEVSSDTLVRLAVTRNMLARGALTSDQWRADLKGKKATVTYGDTRYNGRVSRLGFVRVEQAGGLPAYQIEVSFSATDMIPAQMPVSIEIAD